MIIRNSLELFNLSIVLNDSLICKRLDSKHLKNMIDRYIILIDEFIETYKLPENSDKDSLKN